MRVYTRQIKLSKKRQIVYQAFFSWCYSMPEVELHIMESLKIPSKPSKFLCKLDTILGSNLQISYDNLTITVSYNNGKVTIDFRRMSNLPNVLRKMQGYS